MISLVLARGKYSIFLTYVLYGAYAVSVPLFNGDSSTERCSINIQDLNGTMTIINLNLGQLMSIKPMTQKEATPGIIGHSLLSNE